MFRLALRTFHLLSSLSINLFLFSDSSLIYATPKIYLLPPMTNYTVTNSNDSGAGSLRAAVEEANANLGTDIINLASDVTLESVINLTDSVSLVGSDRTLLSQLKTSRLFEIDDGNGESLIDVTLENLVLTGGLTTDNGGAIFSTENLTLIDSEISGNQAGSSGGGIYQQGASLNVSNSILTSNSAEDSGGAVAVTQTSQVELANTTVSDNSASLGGGVASLDDTSTIEIVDSQVIDNGETNVTGSGFVFVTTQDTPVENIPVEDTPVEELDLAGDTVYSFLDSNLGGNFYTTDENEKDYISDNLSSYQYEGESYQAVNPQGESAESVYRFFNTQTGSHLYTIDEGERDYISSNLDHFAYEGSVFDAFETQQTGSIPIYRFYEPALGTHFYTDDETEMMSMQENVADYNYEGIAYYVMPLEDSVV